MQILEKKMRSIIRATHNDYQSSSVSVDFGA